MKQSLQKSLIWAVIASETSHVFCCVFPTLFSLMSLLSGLGLIVAMPGYMIEMHDLLHHWEIPMIMFSGVVLAFGWIVTLYSERVDCHSTGCGHGDCAPRKGRAHVVLKIATLLFVVNLAVYLTVHRAHWFETGAGAALVHDHDNVPAGQ